MSKAYQSFVATMQKIADVEYSTAVLSWDKEVNLPPKGAKYRSQQVATLSGIAHELFVNNTFAKKLDKLYKNRKDFSPKERKNITLTWKELQKRQRYSTEFVIKSSKATSNAFHAWLKAREANDYQVFKAPLGELIKIKIEEALLLQAKGHPYNGLLDIYESGCTVKFLDPLFTDVRKRLVKLTKKVKAARQVDSRFLYQRFPKSKQWKFGIDLLKNMGYDFDAGRQDVSEHPFTINFSAEDVRVTTRIDENDFGNMTWSCIHEGGHALYEQGLPADDYGLPSGRFISLGIHESQSRLWENNVGRSLPYWKAHYPKLRKLFSKQLEKVSLNKFYKGINKIEPGLIRTEADELHYHFHVLIRYEIEKGLIEGSLDVEGLDKHWNKLYKKYLGVEVPDDKRGILQDIHWAHGSFGYFPTYSLGSFYAAQFYHQAQQDIPGLTHSIEKGDNSTLLSWLRKNIHQHGQLYTADQLCKLITGESLNLKYFMDYATAKYSKIYRID